MKCLTPCLQQASTKASLWNECPVYPGCRVSLSSLCLSVCHMLSENGGGPAHCPALLQIWDNRFHWLSSNSVTYTWIINDIAISQKRILSDHKPFYKAIVLLKDQVSTQFEVLQSKLFYFGSFFLLVSYISSNSILSRWTNVTKLETSLKLIYCLFCLFFDIYIPSHPHKLWLSRKRRRDHLHL